MCPTVNGVHRLVLDNFFKQGCWRAPTNRFETQKSRIKPRAQQVQKVGVNGIQALARFHAGHQRDTHRQQRCGATGGSVDTPKEFLTRRLRHARQRRQRIRRWLRNIGLRCGLNRVPIWRELRRQDGKESLLAIGAQAIPSFDDRGRQCIQIRLPSLGDQLMAGIHQSGKTAIGLRAFAQSEQILPRHHAGINP